MLAQKSSYVLDDYIKVVIISLDKTKGNKIDCSYIGIKPLSIVGKVYCRVMQGLLSNKSSWYNQLIISQDCDTVKRITESIVDEKKKALELYECVQFFAHRIWRKPQRESRPCILCLWIQKRSATI